MITNIKLQIERDNFNNIEIKLSNCEIMAIKELLGLEILLDPIDKNKYKVKKSNENTIMNRLEKIRNK